jgi:UDP-N-acetylmuramoyl-tripeptide--D-alanyl-D-alanine ligase
MRARRLGDIASVVHGTLRDPSGASPDTRVTGVTVDSRAAHAGDLFFALPGDRVDGHGFVGDALSRGAAGAVVRAGWNGGGGPQVEVDDPGRALMDLASDERDHLSGIVVGITGSTGKTCTKDLTASVLSRTFRTVASRASFNNEVGLPLTLLEAGLETEAVVCEMGSRGPGHIELLCRIARPQIGVVTNVGVAHMELFGSPQALRDAKAELPEALPQDGVAVLNADDRVVRSYAERTPAGRVVLFGRSADADVRAESMEMATGTGLAAFDLVTPDGSARVRLGVPGEHMVPNALAAAAVGWALGVPLEDVAEALGDAPISGGRMELVEAGGVRILNDAYNANPTSMAAALKAARWMAGPGHCIAVLGHMAELGPIAGTEHERLGELVARLGIDVIVVVGEEARSIAVGAQRKGVDPERVLMCGGVDEAVDAVASVALPGDLVLVKASRVARLERVVEGLVSRAGKAANAGGTGATDGVAAPVRRAIP